MTAEIGHQQEDHGNGSLKLESRDLERMQKSRVSARERLEDALGPDLTQLLLNALQPETEGLPDDSRSRDHAA
ncbi:MAG: hypothetical protein ACXVZW_10020 [Gaiellaceae bacterium]